MADKHLNLFYSYNASEDAELIENNLTRAFIQTLRALSGRTRNRLLWSLDKRMEEHDFSHAEFALQGHIDKPDCNCLDRYVATIATRAMDADEDSQSERETRESIPDAWLFDKDEHRYCLLIECKRGGNPLDQQQVLSHAKNYFGMDAGEAERRTVSLTWQDVLRAMEEALAQEPRPNEQEEHVLRSLERFLGFFDYRLFKGFSFAKLEPPPAWQLREPVRRALFRFDELRDVPGFRLSSSRVAASEQDGRFCFDQLEPAPTFRLRSATATVTAVKDRLFRLERLGAVPAFSLCNKKGGKHGR